MAELAARYRIIDDDAIQAVISDATSRRYCVAGPSRRRTSTRARAGDAATRRSGTPHRAALRLGGHRAAARRPGSAPRGVRQVAAPGHRAGTLGVWAQARPPRRHHRSVRRPAGHGEDDGRRDRRAVRPDLYRIDLAAVVSKYIGETEKNREDLPRGGSGRRLAVRRSRCDLRKAFGSA